MMPLVSWVEALVMGKVKWKFTLPVLVLQILRDMEVVFKVELVFPDQQTMYKVVQQYLIYKHEI